MKHDATQQQAQRYAQAFEQITASNLDTLMELFSEDARFVDPFNDVTGKAAIRSVFEHMFEKTDNPRFEVHNIAVNQDVAFLSWTFYMQFKQKPDVFSVLGSSQIRINEHGKVIEHIDFWNPCEGLYEKLPFIGALFRWLRRRMSASN